MLSTLAPLFMGAGSAKLSTIETTLKSNTPLLGEMVENYESYKDKAKTKGQYDYRRKTLVKKLTTNLGPTSLLLYGTRPPTEVMRISTTKGTNPTAPIDGEIRKMRRVSTLAKSGGVLLTAVGVGMACSEIASAKTQGEKNEILVESGGSVIGGVAYGLGTSVALFLMATPIGWVAGIAIGVGGVLTSYGVGQGSKAIYNAMGNKLDFAAITGVDQVCSAGKGMRVPMPRISNAAMSVL